MPVTAPLSSLSHSLSLYLCSVSTLNAKQQIYCVFRDAVAFLPFLSTQYTLNVRHRTATLPDTSSLYVSSYSGDRSPDVSCTASATCSIYPIVPRESAAWQHCCWEPGAICIYITTLTAEGRHKVFMSCDINPNSGAVLACKFSSNYYSPAVHDSSLLLTVPSSGKQKCTVIFK